MRIVRHPNIVELKAFYYSNGERVRTVRYRLKLTNGVTNCRTERRSLPQPRLGVCSRDSLQGIEILQQDEDNHANIGS